MVNLLSRLMGLARPGPVDAMLMARHTYGVATDLTAVDVHTDDVGDYNVTEAGWYAVDDADKVVLGPFDSLAQCEHAIQERRQLNDA
jgi:hypothetical protein